MPNRNIATGRRRQIGVRIPSATDSFRAFLMSQIEPADPNELLPYGQRNVPGAVVLKRDARLMLPGSSWSNPYRLLHIRHDTLETLVAAIDNYLVELQRPVFILEQGVHLRNHRAALGHRFDAELLRMGLTDDPLRESWRDRLLDPDSWRLRQTELSLRTHNTPTGVTVSREVEVVPGSNTSILRTMPWLVSHIREEQL